MLDTDLGRMIARAALDHGVYVGHRGRRGRLAGAHYDPNGGPLKFLDAAAAALKDILRAVQLGQPRRVVVA